MNFDLNLLRVFEALYEEGSVTRASHRLCVTQSAVSHALGRLRRVTGNQLFLRVPTGLEPTPFAIAIAPKILESLSIMRQALSGDDFDPETTSRCFTISAGPYHDQLVVIPLVADLAETAPNANLALSDYTTDLIDRIDNRKIDVALGGFSALPERMGHQPLFTDEFVWIARSDHPLASGPVDRQALAAARRARVNSTDLLLGIHGLIQDHGLARRVVNESGYFREDDLGVSRPMTSCYNARTAIGLVEKAGLITYVPRHSVPTDPASRIVVLDVEDAVESFTVSAIWRRDFESDPGLLWLLDRIAAVTACLRPG